MPFDYPPLIWEMKLLLDEGTASSMLKAAELVVAAHRLPESRIQSLRKEYSRLQSLGTLPEKPPVPRALSDSIARRFAAKEASRVDTLKNIAWLKSQAAKYGLTIPAGPEEFAVLQAKTEARYRELAGILGSSYGPRIAEELMKLGPSTPAEAERLYVELRDELERVEKHETILRRLRVYRDLLREEEIPDPGNEPVE